MTGIVPSPVCVGVLRSEWVQFREKQAPKKAWHTFSAILHAIDFTHGGNMVLIPIEWLTYQVMCVTRSPRKAFGA
jgi:hypothetical protein